MATTKRGARGRYVCATCGTRWPTTQSLSAHGRAHKNGHAELTCPECGWEAPTPGGLGRHRATKHDVTSKAAAARSAKAESADELFMKVGAATRALFPDGVPAERVIEIAEVQKAMLTVLRRP